MRNLRMPDRMDCMDCLHTRWPYTTVHNSILICFLLLFVALNSQFFSQCVFLLSVEQDQCPWLVLLSLTARHALTAESICGVMIDETDML